MNESPSPRRRSPSRADAGIGVLLVLAGAWLFAAARPLPGGTSADPVGPQGFPTLLAVALAACGIAVLVEAILGGGPTEPDQSEDEGRGPLSPRRFAAATVISAAYVVALQPLGFLVATPPYLAGLIFLQGGARPPQLLLTVFAFPLALFVLFSLLLGVPLPGGVLDPVVLSGRF